MAGYPYIMQSALFATDSAGSQFLPDERTFRNTTPHYLRVHRLGLHLRTDASLRSLSLDNPGTSAPRPQWAIRFGSTTVTTDFVPLAATTWRPNSDEPAAVVDFAQPVYLAPNDRLDVRFKYLANVSPTTQKFYLAARCSAVDRPDAIRVPALYGWEGTSRAGNDGLFSEEVPVQTFYNEHDESMLVERFIGRLGLFGGYINATTERAFPACRQFLVDLELQDGSKITRDPTPLAALFDLARQSWLMNFNLPSKGYIKATLSGNLTTTATPRTYYPYLGLLGYRTIG